LASARSSSVSGALYVDQIQPQPQQQLDLSPGWVALERADGGVDALADREPRVARPLLHLLVLFPRRRVLLRVDVPRGVAVVVFLAVNKEPGPEPVRLEPGPPGGGSFLLLRLRGRFRAPSILLVRLGQPRRCWDAGVVVVVVVAAAVVAGRRGAHYLSKCPSQPAAAVIKHRSRGLYE
jgi:hypothetical protein